MHEGPVFWNGRSLSSRTRYTQPSPVGLNIAFHRRDNSGLMGSGKLWDYRTHLLPFEQIVEAGFSIYVRLFLIIRREIAVLLAGRPLLAIERKTATTDRKLQTNRRQRQSRSSCVCSPTADHLRTEERDSFLATLPYKSFVLTRQLWPETRLQVVHTVHVAQTGLRHGPRKGSGLPYHIIYKPFNGVMKISWILCHY